MNTNICPRISRFWFLNLFIGFCFLSAVEALQAQSRWSNSAQVNNPIAILSSGQLSPVIARDGQQGAIIVWVDNRSGDFDLYGMRIDVAGDLRWGDGGIPLANEINSQEAPALTEGENGEIFLAWQDNRFISAQREIAAQRFDIAGAPLWSQDARAHVGNNGSPGIFLDGSGNLFTAAYTTIIITQAASVQILDPATGATQFRPLQKILDQQSDALQTDRPPAVAAALSGGVLTAWADGRNDTTLQAVGMLNNGDAWSAGQLTISNDIKPGTFPAIFSDGSQGAILVWIEPVTGSADDIVKARRLNSGGGDVWSPGTQDISTSGGKKRQLKIASDGQNGAFIIWENLLNSNWQILAQRIFPDGQNWNVDTPAAIVSSNQTNAQVINNRRGDAVVVWQDDRDLSSGIDLYAQRISSAGVRAWEPEVAVTTAANSQQKPALTDDGFGGAIVAWEDLRNGNADIFAQRLSPTGVLGEFRTITVAAPAQDENWEIGSQRTIQWAASPEIDSAKIELSRDGGQSFEIVSQSVANANPQNNSQALTLAGIPATNCIVRVTAIKADFIFGVSEAFTISAPQGPSVAPLQVQEATAGQNLEISSDATDLSGVQTVQLNYRLGGARTFTAVNMTASGQNQFRATIPADAVTERGVEYFVRATDNIGTANNSDTFFVNVNFEAGQQTERVNRGSRQNAFRMFSAPNILDQPAAAAIFLNSNFGAYDTTSWRLFQFRNNAYVEFDTLQAAGTFQFSPGQAFWLISARDRTIDFGAGQSQRSDGNATVTIQPGWNQVGNPFGFLVEWDTVMTASGNPDLLGPYSYEGSFAIVPFIEAYGGYFVLNRSTGPVTLSFPPVESPVVPVATAKQLAVAGAEWRLQIHAECQEARDDFNVLGIHPQSVEEWDRQDYPEPPPIGEFVSVYFPRGDWEVYPSDYTTDFRAGVGPGQTWSFNVRSNIANAAARVHVAGLETLPKNLEVWLVDEKLNVKQDIRNENHFVIPTGDHGITKSLKLLIGTSEFLANELSDQSFIPRDFELAQNFPNPFNPTTAIRYGLPQASRVTLKIYDLLGREVITLVDNENKQPGYHLVAWNGKDKSGGGVASGLYVYRMVADNFVQSRKMLIVK